MIPVINIIQGIDDKLNKNSNLEGQYIPLETKILAANKMQIKLILKKVGVSNNYNLGLDSFKKRYEDLQFLIVPFQKLSVTKTPDDRLNSYQADRNTLMNSLFLSLDSYVLATRGNCKDRILRVIETVEHADIQYKLLSPHYTPRFDYQETISTMSGDIIYVYGDKENSFTITDLFITYLRYPAYIDFPGYQKLDNTPSTLQNCELDSYLENELIDLIVEELAMNVGDQQVTQYSEQRGKENE